VPRFAYPCPHCRTTDNLHERSCRFDDRAWTEIERAYIDIVSVLSAGGHTRTELESTAPDWGPLHDAALDRLEQERRVVDRDERLVLLTPDEFREQVTAAAREPIKTIYEQGSVPGAHDNAVFAMIAWYEMVGLSWPETKAKVVQWLRESGTWDRGGFEESTPEQLVEGKRHVYAEGYGWKEKAQAAKRVIERAS
jgi:hypothetical protein